MHQTDSSKSMINSGTFDKCRWIQRLKGDWDLNTFPLSMQCLLCLHLNIFRSQTLIINTFSNIFSNHPPLLELTSCQKCDIWAICCGSSSKLLFILLTLRAHKSQSQFNANICNWNIKRYKFSSDSLCYIFFLVLSYILY